jgi:hypothetical protein
MILSGGLFYYAWAGLFAGIALLAKGVPTFLLKRLIENTPTSKVRSAAVGLVEVCGSVVLCEEKFKSPFTGKDCAYHMCTVENFMGGSRARWFQVLYDEKRAPFYVRDDTGKILIDPDKAFIQISLKEEYESGPNEEPPARIIEYLKTNEMAHKGLLGRNKTMRFREYTIAEGDKVYVMGKAERDTDCRERDQEIGADNLVLHKGSDNEVFYISDRPERKILQKLQNKLDWSTYGGTMLSGLCLAYIILFYLGIL